MRQRHTALFFVFMLGFVASTLATTNETPIKGECAFSEGGKTAAAPLQLTQRECREQCRSKYSQRSGDTKDSLVCLWEKLDQTVEFLTANNLSESPRDSAIVSTVSTAKVAGQQETTSQSRPMSNASNPVISSGSSAQSGSQNNTWSYSSQSFQARVQNIEDQILISRGLTLNDAQASSMKKNLDKVLDYQRSAMADGKITEAESKKIDTMFLAVEASLSRATGKGFDASFDALSSMISTLKNIDAIGELDRLRIQKMIAEYKSKHKAYSVGGLSTDESRKLNDEYFKIQKAIEDSQRFHKDIGKILDLIVTDIKKARIAEALRDRLWAEAKNIHSEYFKLTSAQAIAKTQSFKNRMIAIDKQLLGSMGGGGRNVGAANNHILQRIEQLK